MNPSYDCIDLNFRKNRANCFKLKRNENEKAKIKQKFFQFNAYLKTFGLSFTKIEVSYEYGKNDFKFDIIENTTATAENQASLCQTALMSERAYQRFRKTISSIAKLSSIRQCNAYKNQVNRFWAVKTNSMGYYVEEPITKIKYVCLKFLDKLTKLTPPQKVKDNTFFIQLSGDGVNIIKRLF